MLAGTMLASMLGGANNATGSSGGGFAQMLGQIASSPAMQQLASSPTVQNAMQPLLSGGNDASGCDARFCFRFALGGQAAIPANRLTAAVLCTGVQPLDRSTLAP